MFITDEEINYKTECKIAYWSGKQSELLGILNSWKSELDPHQDMIPVLIKL